MNRVCKAPELSDQDQEMLGPSTLPGRIVANLMMGAKLGLHIPAANNQHRSIRHTILSLSSAPIRVEGLTRSCAKRTTDALDERRTSSTSHRAPTSLAITLVRLRCFPSTVPLGSVRIKICDIEFPESGKIGALGEALSFEQRESSLDGTRCLSKSKSQFRFVYYRYFRFIQLIFHFPKIQDSLDKFLLSCFGAPPCTSRMEVMNDLT